MNDLYFDLIRSPGFLWFVAWEINHLAWEHSLRKQAIRCGSDKLWMFSSSITLSHCPLATYFRAAIDHTVECKTAIAHGKLRRAGRMTQQFQLSIECLNVHVVSLSSEILYISQWNLNTSTWDFKRCILVEVKIVGLVVFDGRNVCEHWIMLGSVSQNCLQMVKLKVNFEIYIADRKATTCI